MICIFYNQGRRKVNRMTQRNIEDGVRPKLMTSRVGELARNLVWALTQQNPLKRVCMNDAVNHPFFSTTQNHIHAILQVGELSRLRLPEFERFNESFIFFFTF